MTRAEVHGSTFDDEGVAADTLAALDERILQMRRVLALARPGSHAEALKTLRDIFPDASLSERVAVLGSLGA